MIIKHRGVEPRIDSTVFIAPTAVIAGNVQVGPRTRIMYGAIVDSEASAIEIGECSIICENAVLRASKIEDNNHPVHIGDHAFISPHTTLLGCSVASHAYIATGATVLQGAEVDKGAVVAVDGGRTTLEVRALIAHGLRVRPDERDHRLRGVDDVDRLDTAVVRVAAIVYGDPRSPDHIFMIARAQRYFVIEIH